MIYFLDTTAVSDLMAGEPRTTARMAAVRSPDRVVTSPVVRGEILFGIARLPAGKRRTGLENNAARVFSSVPCEPTPVGAADHYAAAKLSCELAGAPLADNDLWIAASALHGGAVVVSRDAHFKRVPGLAVEDWTA